MNYFAHGLHFIDQPYFLAGTAVPDWMNIVDRRVRVRRKYAQPYVDDADPRVAALARGVIQHHADDAWFHETPAFTELSWHLTRRIRDALPGDDGFRPSFLGHILVELLLDAELVRRDPDRLEAYYAAFDEIDPDLIESAINRMAARQTDRLAELIPLFSRERFLFDYADDDKLWFRLNQVMRRVALPALPESFTQTLAEARPLIAERAGELLSGAGAAPGETSSSG